MFLTFDDDWYEKRFNLHGIHDIKDWPCIKEIGKLHCPLNLYIVNQCDGLLLCLAEGIGAKASGMGPHEIYDFKSSSWRVLNICVLEGNY
ncbi:unnamed protein product [Brassica oleracea]